MKNKHYHTPVLFNEALQYLNISPSGSYLDCTLGEAGHSLGILEKLNEKGSLTSFDQDQEAIDFVNSEYSAQIKSNNWKIVKTNFSKMDDFIETSSLSGVLMDIGLSSRQIEIPGRGFSYNEDEDQLDMRMDKEIGVKASDLFNELDEKQLDKLFFTYGE